MCTTLAVMRALAGRARCRAPYIYCTPQAYRASCSWGLVKQARLISWTPPQCAPSDSSSNVIGTLGGRELVQAGSVDPKEFFVKRITRDDVTATFSRSSGAGGQNVNKVSTKADLRFDLINCKWMSQKLKQAVMKREATRMNKQGELLISSQVTRSQLENLTDALGRLQTLLDTAADSIKPVESDPQKVRALKKRKDKADKRRLEGKKKHKDKKNARKRVGKADW